jgi:DNA-binding GntR family transcriptional regulator
LKRLEGIIKRAEKGLENGDFKVCKEQDSLFHQEIAKSTENWKLIIYLKEIEDFMHIAWAMGKKTMARQRDKKSLEQHWSIFNSIKARDKTAAIEAVDRNIDQLRFHLGLKKWPMSESIKARGDHH